jgi:ParB-like chromosome segregation protein Spo0J
MIRPIVLGLLLALATFSSPARAQDPVDEPAKPARQAQAKRAEARLWWNDPAVVEKLELSGDQRAQMDQLFETYLSERKKAATSSNARKPFFAALEQGDMDGARRELASWAEGERAGIQAGGKLKIEVLELLSEEQRKALASAYPLLVRKAWAARPSWEPAPAPKRPAGPTRQEKPAN